MSGYLSVVDAELDAMNKRARFARTASALKARVEPSRLVESAAASARSEAVGLLRTATGKVRGRPGPAVTIAGGLLLFALRRPLFRAVGRTRRRDDGRKRGKA